MSIQSITSAQRLAIRDAAFKLAHATQVFAEDYTSPEDVSAAAITTLMTDLAATLVTAGVSSVPSGAAVVTNGIQSKIYATDGSTVVASSPLALVSNGTYLGTRFANGSNSIVSTGNSIAIQNSAGTAIGNASVTVASNVFSYGRLPSTVAGVTNGTAFSASVTFTTARSAGATATLSLTPTVASGVISAITVP